MFEHNFSCFSPTLLLGFLDGFILIGSIQPSVHPLRTAVRPTRTFGVGRSRYKAARRWLQLLEREGLRKKARPGFVSDVMWSHRPLWQGPTTIKHRGSIRCGRARSGFVTYAQQRSKTKRVDPGWTARPRRTEAQRWSAIPESTAALFCLKKRVTLLTSGGINSPWATANPVLDAHIHSGAWTLREWTGQHQVD